MSEPSDFTNSIDWAKYAPTATTSVPVNTAPAATTSGSSGLFGVLGSSVGTLASSYLDALGKKLAGVNTTATPADPATTDAAKSAAAATAAANQMQVNLQPVLIVGLVAVVGIGLVVALRR